MAANNSPLASRWMRHTICASLLLALASRTSGLAISYCSPDLTAGNFQAVFNTYQTNGACADTCGSQYAYAILKGSNCWCSNYAPADQVSTYDCYTTCPGWPSDWCGNEEKGLYGYYQLDGKAPSGTAGGSGGSGGSSSTGSPSASDPTRTSSSTDETSSTVPVIVPVASETSSIQSQQQPQTTSTASPTTAPKPSPPPTQAYTSIMTVTGQVKTLTITPTPTSDSTLGSGTAINSSGGGVSTGKVVGIVLGVALGLGLLIGLGVFFCLRRRNKRQAEAAPYDNMSSTGNNSIPSRQVSQMSSAGLLSKTPRIFTHGLPSGNNPRSADTSGSNFDRRSLGTDQRLNPYAIYAHDESRNSNVSLQDNQDYSRQLRVANPDP